MHADALNSCALHAAIWPRRHLTAAVQVLVLFLGVHWVMWHRPSELVPFASAREDKLAEGRHLHDSKKLGKSLKFTQLQAAAEVGYWVGMLLPLHPQQGCVRAHPLCGSTKPGTPILVSR